MRAFCRFEELSSIVKNKTSIEEDSITREGIAKLAENYQKYKSLLSELEQCTKEYVKKKKSVQGVMFKSIRKMNTEIGKTQYRKT
ncbi:hypothetical protein ACLI09_02735 [Flavobacterium sp. RHBU_24]|uniref:hypothetical protein n=1 Tax=Flavobacterium sp. RHBU_24 TaxID=3391185 RepID=UPI003984CC01